MASSHSLYRRTVYIQIHNGKGCIPLTPVLFMIFIIFMLLFCNLILFMQATNDDLILISSLKLHERVDSQPGHCSVVLLTDDRNLRVKSHASHMPVKNIQKFMGLFYSRQ